MSGWRVHFCWLWTSKGQEDKAEFLLFFSSSVALQSKLCEISLYLNDILCEKKITLTVAEILYLWCATRQAETGPSHWGMEISFWGSFTNFPAAALNIGHYSNK